MNAQIAIRGVADAFDGLAAVGCEGWASSDVLPIFSAIEDDPEAPHPEQHGRGGRFHAIGRRCTAGGPIDQAVRTAALDLGYPWYDDLNAASGEGVACYPINNRSGRRISTNEAYSSRRVIGPISQSSAKRLSIGFYSTGPSRPACVSACLAKDGEISRQERSF